MSAKAVGSPLGVAPISLLNKWTILSGGEIE